MREQHEMRTNQERDVDETRITGDEVTINSERQPQVMG
jgi:hypothetical protein